MSRENRFNELREKWNNISAETIKEIENILKETEGKEIDLNNSSFQFAGNAYEYEEQISSIKMDENEDVYLVSVEGEEHTLGELACGEELWVLWQMI